MGNWFIIVAVFAALWTLKWLADSEIREYRNRRHDMWVRARDFCPRCGAEEVVVVSASSPGALYGACKACDEEVLL